MDGETTKKEAPKMSGSESGSAAVMTVVGQKMAGLLKALFGCLGGGGGRR